MTAAAGTRQPRRRLPPSALPLVAFAAMAAFVLALNARKEQQTQQLSEGITVCNDPAWHCTALSSQKPLLLPSSADCRCLQACPHRTSITRPTRRLQSCRPWQLHPRTQQQQQQQQRIRERQHEPRVNVEQCQQSGQTLRYRRVRRAAKQHSIPPTSLTERQQPQPAQRLVRQQKQLSRGMQQAMTRSSQRPHRMRQTWPMHRSSLSASACCG